MNKIKNLLISMIIVSSALQAAPTFELYNKADKAINITLNNQKYTVPSKKQLPLNITITHPLQLSIVENNTSQDFTINAQGKRTVYVTWNPAKSPYLYPQTGPWLGFLGKTESGLPLDKKMNVAQHEIQKSSRNSLVNNQPEPVPSECCICMEETDLMPIPCENKHNERICKSCLDTIMNKNAECPICRGKLRKP